MPWIPFDADDEEIAQLQVLRENIGPGLRAPLRSWIVQTCRIAGDGTYASLDKAQGIQSALQIDLHTPSRGLYESATLLRYLEQDGDRTVFRAIDYLLSLRFVGDNPVKLNEHLELNSSAFRAELIAGQWRLRGIMPKGVSQVVESTMTLDHQAGGLLSEAWSFAYGIDPKPVQAMDAAVRAVETLAIARMVPNKRNATLGDAIGTMRAQGDWGHDLRELDGKAPAQETIWAMLQTLWAGQQYRHVHKEAAPPTVDQARTHVQLAATLVGWLASGAVKRIPKDKVAPGSSTST